LYGKGKENHNLGRGVFGNHITEVTVKRAELVIVRISYIAQRDRWFKPLALELDIYSLAHHLCKM
jgi:hypothetical protein